MIANAMKIQLFGSSSSGLCYTKPYTKRIDNLCMPLGYQPPEFYNLMERKYKTTCSTLCRDMQQCWHGGCDLLIKQFVCSLKKIAFDWLYGLKAKSIENWDHIEGKFLNRFYCTRRVGQHEWAKNTRKWEDEPVVEYICRWCALSFECKDRISEAFVVEMRINDMSWDLIYIFKGIKPRSFQDLVTWARDIEITVKGHEKRNASSSKAVVDKKEYKNWQVL